jgi:hypothetical protein
MDALGKRIGDAVEVFDPEDGNSMYPQNSENITPKDTA